MHIKDVSTFRVRLMSLSSAGDLSYVAPQVFVQSHFPNWIAHSNKKWHHLSVVKPFYVGKPKRRGQCRQSESQQVRQIVKKCTGDRGKQSSKGRKESWMHKGVMLRSKYKGEERQKCENSVVILYEPPSPFSLSPLVTLDYRSQQQNTKWLLYPERKVPQRQTSVKVTSESGRSELIYHCSPSRACGRVRRDHLS